MNKRIFANRFGLFALMSLSLFASTAAFAGNTPAPTQVVVANTPAQPVPMVGLVKDSDASARKPFQWYGTVSAYNGGTLKVTTAPANQRLVIEDVSGYCDAGTTFLEMKTWNQNFAPAYHYLSAAFWNGTGPASTPVRFYVDPGLDLDLYMAWNNASAMCHLAVSGYLVDLP